MVSRNRNKLRQPRPAGIDYRFGAVWAGVAIFAALMFRFALPIIIGEFSEQWMFSIGTGR